MTSERADWPQGVIITQIATIFAVLLVVSAPCCADLTREAPTSTPRVHVACASPTGGVLWAGDAPRADYRDGEWTICPTSEPCADGETRVRTSAPCVVTPLSETGP